MHGIVGNNPANDPDKKPVKSRSKFHPNVSVFQTMLYGLNSPFFGMEVVPDDALSLRVQSDVDTFTLGAPIMHPVKMNKDYFFIPQRAIVPHNSDYIVTNPLTGDDIDAEAANSLLDPMNICGASISDTKLTGEASGLKPYARCIAGSADPSESHWGELLSVIVGENGNGSAFTVPLNWNAQLFGTAIRAYTWTWFLFSYGAPLRALGYNFQTLFRGPIPTAVTGKRAYSYDQWFEAIFTELKKNLQSVTVKVIDSVGSVHPNGYPTGASDLRKTLTVVFDNSLTTRPQDGIVSFRHFLQMVQQGTLLVQVTGAVASSTIGTNTKLTPDDFATAADFANINVGIFSSLKSDAVETLEATPLINVNRVIGYQLASAQFYTNDAIDYVYSCDLWHQNQHSLLRTMFSTGQNASIFNNLQHFLLNGIAMDYDTTSYMWMNRALTYLWKYCPLKGSSAITSPAYDAYSVADWSAVGGERCEVYRMFAWLGYLVNLFGYTRTLRYRDYFVGAKPRPLAVGEVNVTVVGGQFSVVDVTKNIQRQRFLNQVNRIGRSLAEYTRGIFGVAPQKDPHCAVFLGSSTDVIGAQETENTGSDQYSSSNGITSKFRNDSSRFAFEGSFAENGVIVGVVNFDCPRPYTDQLDAENLHSDRYNMFNPYMQTIGDQPVYGYEQSLQMGSQDYGYQLRYSEYKQRVDYVAGGFVDYLPGYTFLSRPEDLLPPDTGLLGISPDTIRQNPREFDRFYLHFAGDDAAAYFHFMARHDVNVDADRPMLAAPSIL